MDEIIAKNMVDEIFLNIFKQKCPFSLESIIKEFAFDIRLPQEVKDSLTGERTWTSSANAKQFITQTNMERYDEKYGWMLQKKEFSNLEQLLNIWKKVNYITTERVYDSINVAKSDPIYKSENVYMCTDCRGCKDILFSDGCGSCQGIIASQRSADCTYCLRVDDSNSCSNSYNVICSAKISNSFFIQDCNNLYECMFCSHIASKRYCIANMEFNREEYFEIKKQIINWILSSGN